MNMAKKSFKQTNPAEAFITKAEPETTPTPAPEVSVASVATETPRKPPQGYKFNPAYIETKSKRVQLLLQPSTVERLKAVAKAKGLSMNETANEAILQYLAKEDAK